MCNYLRKNKKRGLSMIEYLKIKQKPLSVVRKKKKYSRIKKKRNSVLTLQKNFYKTLSENPVLHLQKRSKFMKKLLLKRSFLKKKKSTVLAFLNPSLSKNTITRKFAFKLYNYKFKFRQKINFYNATLCQTS